MSNLEEIKKAIKEKTKGKKAGSAVFNKEEYLNFIKTGLNEVDMEVEVVTKRDKDTGHVETKKIKPVEKFRNEFIKPILMEYGVDESEASQIKTSEIKSVGGIYECMKELDYQYMETGRRIDYLPKEDFQGSMYLERKGEVTKDFKVPNKKDEEGNDITVRRTIEEHIELKAKSKTPDNKKKDHQK